MDFDCGIYAIVGPNGRRYIGQAQSFKTRWRFHRGLLRSGKHHCRALQLAWNKYGEKSFLFSKIAIVPQADLTFREQEQFDSYLTAGNRKELYNTSMQAGSPMKGRSHSEDTRNRMSLARRGKPGVNLGRKFDEAWCRSMSEARKGRNGKPCSEETKAKISAAQIGVRAGENHPRYGKAHTEETRRKISAAMIGKLIGEKNPRARSVICISTGQEFSTMNDAVMWLRSAGKLTASSSKVCLACSGKRRAAYGHRWAYTDIEMTKEAA